MLPPLASVPELIKRMGLSTLDGTETARAEAALDDASGLVREEAGRDWVNPDTGQLDGVPQAIATVVLRAARREMDNPQGYTSESDGDYTYRREADAGIGVYLTEDEKSIARRYRSTQNPALWTLPTTRGEHCSNTLWVEDQYGTELWPLYALDGYGRPL